MFTTVDKNLLIAAMESAIFQVYQRANITSLSVIESRVSALRQKFDATPEQTTDAEIFALIDTIQQAQVPDFTRIDSVPRPDVAYSYIWERILNKPTTFPSDWNTTANKPELAAADHTHDAYALTGHGHADLAAATHTHDAYALTEHGHADLAAATHNHDAAYALTAHGHADLAAATHTHLTCESFSWTGDGESSRLLIIPTTGGAREVKAATIVTTGWPPATWTRANIVAIFTCAGWPVTAAVNCVSAPGHSAEFRLMMTVYNANACFNVASRTYYITVWY